MGGLVQAVNKQVMDYLSGTKLDQIIGNACSVSGSSKNGEDQT
jgi:hypothetical protein